MFTVVSVKETFPSAFLKALDDAGIHALDVGLKRPSLDDVFLSLTGHSAENTENAENGEAK